MTKLLLGISLTIDPRSMDADTAAQYIVDVDTRLRMLGYGATETNVAPAAKAKTPLVAQWCAEKNVTRVRCTEGRTPEEQAEYNLRTYMGYTDDQIDKIRDTYQPIPSQTITDETVEDDGNEHDETELI
jgi:hypothetical protein